MRHQTFLRTFGHALVCLLAFFILARAPAGAAPIRVAFFDLASPDFRPRHERAANGLSEMLRALVQAEGDFDWVERQELNLIIDEMQLTGEGFGSRRGRLRAAHWLQADLLISGSFIFGADRRPTAEVEIIDVRRADLLGSISFAARDDEEPHPSRDIWNPSGARAGAARLSNELQRVAGELARDEERPVVAPLFFVNAGRYPRTSLLEGRIFSALEVAPKAGPRVLRFPRVREAAGEVELAALGLAEADPAAARRVADLYVWGEFTELDPPAGQAEVPFPEAEVELRLFFWDGAQQVREEMLRGKLAEANELAGRAAQRVLAMAGDHTPAGGEEDPAAVSRRLAERALATYRDLQQRNRAFLQTDEGRQRYAYILQLLNAALFFNPLETDVQRERIEILSRADNPLWSSELQTQWSVVTELNHYLHRFAAEPLKFHSPVAGLMERKVNLLGEISKSARRAFEGGLVSEAVAHTNIQRAMADMLPAADTLFRLIWEDENIDATTRDTKTRAWLNLALAPRDAEVLLDAVETLWPWIARDLTQARAGNRTIGMDTFDRRVELIHSIYRTFGEDAKSLRRLNDLENSPPAPARSVVQRNARPWSSPRAETPTLNDGELPLVLEEQPILPRPTEIRVNQPRYPLRTIHALTFQEGRLWISEVNPSASYSWRNPRGNQYLWSWTPATGETELSSRALGPHGQINDIRLHQDRIWLAMEDEGVWLWDGENPPARMGLEEGLTTTRIRSINTQGATVLAAGEAEGRTTLNRKEDVEEKWSHIVPPMTPGRQSGNPAHLGQAAVLEHWQFTYDQFPRIYDLDARQWISMRPLQERRMEEIRARAAGKRPPPGQTPLHARRNYPVVIAAGPDGFWLAEQGELSFLDPRDLASRYFKTEAGQVTAMVAEGEHLWVAERDGPPLRDRASPPKIESRIRLFNTKNHEWLGEVTVPHHEITALEVTPGKLWVGGQTILVADTTHLVPLHVPSPLSEGPPSAGEGAPSLLRSAHAGDVEAARRLLAGGADPNEQNSGTAWTALHAAVEAGHVAVARELLTAGADVDAIADDGAFPLLLSTERQDVEMAKLLLDAGADPNLQREPVAADRINRTEAHYLTTAHLNFGREESVPAYTLRGVSAWALSHREVEISWDPVPGVFVHIVQRREPHGLQTVGLVPGEEGGMVDQIETDWRTGSRVSYELSVPQEGESASMVKTNVVEVPPAPPPSEVQVRDRGAALHIAARRGDLEMMQVLLDYEADIERRDARGETPLLRAARESDRAAVELLLERGADRNAACDGNMTLARWVYQHREDHPFFLSLLESGISFQGANRWLLVDAAHDGSPADIDDILKAGADLHVVNMRGTSAVSAALSAGREEIALHLLSKGFQPAAMFQHLWGRREIGADALVAAVRQQQHAALEELLRRGASTAVPDGAFAASPLHLAAESTDAQAVRLLLNYGADPNVLLSSKRPADLTTSAEVKALLSGDSEARYLVRPKGDILSVGAVSEGIPMRGELEQTQALVSSIQRGDAAGVAAGLSRGANPDGTTVVAPLAIAASLGRLDLMEMLLQSGARVNRTDGEDVSILTHAVRSGDAAAVDLLLEEAAHPSFATGRRLSAFSQAAADGDVETLHLMLTSGAAPVAFSGSNLEPWTPLMAAAARGQTEAIQFLLSRGVPVDAHARYFDRPWRKREVELIIGPTALLLAAMSDNPDAVEALLTAGANLHHTTEDGQNAADWAAGVEASRTLALLRARGLEPTGNRSNRTQRTRTSPHESVEARERP